MSKSCLIVRLRLMCRVRAGLVAALWLAGVLAAGGKLGHLAEGDVLLLK